jgi:hypothetical protein
MASVAHLCAAEHRLRITALCKCQPQQYLLKLLEKPTVAQLVNKSPPTQPLVRYRVHNSPPLSTILSHTDTVHNLTLNFPRIYFNIVLPSTPMSSELSLPFSFSNQNGVRTSHHSCLLHAQPISFSLTLWRRLLCNVLQPITSSLVGPNILLSTLFSNTANLSSSLNVIHQVLHQFKTGKTI